MAFSLISLTLWAAVVTLFTASYGQSLVQEPWEVLSTSSFSSYSLRQRDTTSVSLRILPLGASITWGYLSSTGNGYRKFLRDQLRFSGYPVDMVGTKENGDMVDKDVEAHIGDTISQVQLAAQGSIKYQPNVVLINAGTNDCLQTLDIPDAGSRMKLLVDMLLQGIAGTTIVLSTLIPCGDPSCINDNRLSINTQIRGLVTQYQAAGQKVTLADMDPSWPSQAEGWLNLDTDYANPIHPNDQGYEKMADIWWNALEQALNNNLITAPGPSTAIEEGGDCNKQYGDGVYAGGLTQTGSGQDDDIYRHNSQSMGVVLTVESPYGDRGQWFFARLYDRSRDDFVGWYERTDGSQWYGVWRNTGDASNIYVKIADMNVVIPCIPEGVNFVDVNADGLDDMVCIGKDGSAYAAINQGNGDADNPPTFVDHGEIMAGMAGYPQAQVRLGDVDGDGRADYCVFDPNGDMSCWRNGWVEDTPTYWQALGKRFTGRDMGNLTGVRLEDINGDGRDDWVWIGDTGEAYLETNSRSCDKGVPGDGLNIAWRQGFWQGENSGPAFNGMGVSGVRYRIHFARVYGEPEAFGLLGRQDYVYLEHSTDGDNDKFDMYVWKNIGSGSTKLKADGDKYCNMVGHSNGMMDYVWTLSTGQMTLYTNRGMTNVINGGLSFWDAAIQIFDPLDWGLTLDRRDLHLIDWDGDGACDIVWVDPDNENRPQLWLNQYKTTGTWSWEYNANPAPDLYCPQTRGVGIFDLPVQFADISGNGRGDYLCLEKDGRTWGWIHNSDDTWEYSSQFKYSEEKDRANLHWADVNGDGRADLIWTDKFSGDGWVWYNNGPKDIDGSTYEWVPQGALYMGNRAGTCMYYPDLLGNGRADMHALTGTFTNQAETWFNECEVDHQGDDPDSLIDPDLILQPNPTVNLEPTGGWSSIQCDAACPANLVDSCSATVSTGFCDSGCITCSLSPGYCQWNGVDANDAWDASIAYWKRWNATFPGNSTFSEVIAQSVHGPNEFYCLNIPNDACSSPVDCDTATSGVAHGVSSPAGYMIINSMVAIHANIDGIYTAVHNAMLDAEGSSWQVAKDFSAFTDSEALEITLDIFTTIFGLVSAPFWNSWLKKIENYEDWSNTAETSKDALNSIISNGASLAKDTASASSDLDEGAKLVTLVQNIGSAILDVNNQTANILFNGTNTTTLTNLMYNGGAIGQTSLDPSNMENQFLQALIAMLIPISWADSNVLFPVILNTGGLEKYNDDDDDCASDSWNIDEYMLNKAYAEKSFFCVNGSPFWLVQGSAGPCSYNKVNTCDVEGGGGYTNTGMRINPVPGIETLDGNSYGGLTGIQLINSALNGYNDNGQKNGWSAIDPTASSSLTALANQGVEAAGVFNVPICGVGEALDNLALNSGAKDKSGYPCNTS